MSVAELINSYVVEEDLQVQKDEASKLARNFTLLQIVLGLEDPLTQEDALVRSKATKCLADVISSLDKLNSQELNVLTVFLSDRLSDNQSVANAAMGLRFLATKENGAKLPVNSAFWQKLREVNMLSLDLESRYEVFKLLDAMALKQMMSDEFVTVFTALAGGEKDPRNLMLNLRISRRILEARGMGLDAERRAEIYDITFCYFPVKFHPPKDMPYQITAEEIKTNLGKTLSRPEIAEWVIPALITKLTAVSVIVKLDTLKVLEMTLDGLAQDDGLIRFWPQVWEGLKYEVLHGTPENDTYKPVIQILSKFVGIPEYIAAVKSELEPETIPKSKLYQLSHLVIGLSTSEEIWKELAPLAVAKSLSQPVVLNLFLNKEYGVPHADQVFQALLQAIAQDHKKDGIEGLKRLANNPQGSDFVPLIVQTLTQEKAYAELAELAATHENAVRDHTLPQLISELPDTLEPLGKICCVRSLVQVLSVRLISRLDFQSGNDALKLLQTLIVATGHLSSSDFVGFDRVLTFPLLKKLAEVKPMKLSDVIIDAIGLLTERATRGVSEEHQSVYISNVRSFLGKVHFHIILSSLAAMRSFPFEPGFLKSYVVPRLLSSKSVLERAAYLRLVALAANKWPQQSLLEEEVAEGDYTGLEISVWQTKGLLLKADPHGFERATEFCDIALKDSATAALFGVLVVSDRILSKENGCTVRQLYRQRLFTIILPKLIAQDVSTESLLILSALLKYIPQAVVAPRFDEILEMLMSSLNSELPLLQETAVQSIYASLPSSAPTLQTYLHAMVPRLLEISTMAASTTAARLGALETITALREALPGETAPFKEQVITSLVPALSDPKRAVRKQAVKCRQVFY